MPIHGLGNVLGHVRRKLDGTVTFPSQDMCRQQYFQLLQLWKSKTLGSGAEVRFYKDHKFDWVEFWRTVHVEPGWVTATTWHAFLVFHCIGMIGSSEAAAESVAGF